MQNCAEKTYQGGKMGGQQHINDDGKPISLGQLQGGFEGGNQNHAEPSQQIADEGDVDLSRMLQQKWNCFCICR